eukprot:1627741-Alexandrium_andersonii.AAC.1
MPGCTRTCTHGRAALQTDSHGAIGVERRVVAPHDAASGALREVAAGVPRAAVGVQHGAVDVQH